MKRWQIAVAYVGAGALVVALVAMPLVPLWRTWYGNILDFQDYVEENRATLIELSQREGPAAVAPAVRALANDLRGDWFILFGGPGREILAGSLREWPTGIPETPLQGFRVTATMGGEKERLVVWQEVLPGGYRLLFGRIAIPQQVIAKRMFYGLGGAMAILTLFGAAALWLLARRSSAVRRSEERYALAMRASGEGHWDWNMVTDEFYVSPRYLEFGGFPPDFKYTKRADVIDRIPFHPDDRPKYEAAVAAHFAGETPRVDVVIRVTPNGELRWLHVIGVCSRDAAGKPVRWAGSVNDITERMRAEDALRLSAERDAVALEVAQEGNFDWNVQTDEFYASPQTMRVYGTPLDAKFRTRTEGLALVKFDPEDWPRASSEWREALAGQGIKHEFEYRILRDGEIRWIQSRWRVFRNSAGVALRVIGVVSDISERKQAEEALRATQEKFATLFRESPAATALHRLSDGRAIDINPAWSETFGYSREQAIGRNTQELGMYKDPSQRAHFYATLTRDGRVRRMPMTFCRGDGEERTCLLSARLIEVNGETMFIIGGIDITERKRAEETLRLSEQRYARAMEAAQDSHWDWNLATGDYYLSPNSDQMWGFPPGTAARVATRDDCHDVAPWLPEDRDRWLRATQELFAGTGDRLDMVIRANVRGGLIWAQLKGICSRDAAGKAVRFSGSARDVTESKLAEQQLRLSQERYALAMQASQAGHWDWKIDTDEFYASPRFLEFGGFPADIRYSGRGDIVSRIPYYAGDREAWQAAVDAHFAGETPRVDMEIRVVPDGQLRWLHVIGMCSRDANAKPVRWAGSVMDITARKLAEERLRVSEERYSLAMAASEEGHFDHEVGTDELFTSDRLNEIYGVPPGTRFDKGDDYLSYFRFYGNDGEIYHAALRRAIEQGAPDRHELEYRILRPSGEMRWLRMRSKVTRDAEGRALRCTGVVADITERKRAEEALRVSEYRYAAAMDVSTVGHLDWNVATQEFFASDQARRVMNLPLGVEYRASDDVIGRVPYHPDDRLRVQEAWRASLKGSGSEHELEFRVMRGEEARFVHVRWKLFRDADGALQRVIGVLTDITARKQAEEELREMEGALRQAQRLEAMGTLAGGIAHDFNNILGAILGYGEMAMRDAKAGSRLRRDLDSIMAAGERGRALVDRVLAFSRSGVGEHVPVHVEAVVREAMDQVAAKLAPNVTLRPRLRAGRAAMLGDPTQVHQVVMNLATNAAQAMPDGGKLGIALETLQQDAARRAAVGSLVPGDYLVLKVSDTGTGISSEVLEHMFDPFFTTKEVGVGSGLGLSLVHGIVTSVEGAIDVATELGKGTTFTVYLRRSGDAPEEQANGSQPLPRGKGERVLVVDDEEPLVHLATETLEDLGYAPIGFTSSAAALAAFCADPGRFDAVLTDERMPGMSGTTLIREVRGIRNTIPVVLMSGYPRLDGVEADVVVRKPLSARDLAASIARALSP